MTGFKGQRGEPASVCWHTNLRLKNKDALTHPAGSQMAYNFSVTKEPAVSHEVQCRRRNKKNQNKAERRRTGTKPFRHAQTTRTGRGSEVTHTKDTDYLQWFTFSSYKGPRCLSIKVLWLFTTFLSRCEIADLEMSSGGSEQEDVRVFIRRETDRLSQDRQTAVIRAHNSSRDRSHLLKELFPAWICHLVGTEVTAATPTVPPLSFQCTLERETTCFCVQTGPWKQWGLTGL